MRRYICKPSPSKPSKKKKPSIFSRKVHLEKERSTSNITGEEKRISVHSRSSQKIAITEASHSAPLPPQLVRPFIVPSLFAWPLIRPLCSIKASVQGTSSGPESAFNNHPFLGTIVGNVSSAETCPFEVDPATRVGLPPRGEEEGTALKESSRSLTGAR